MNKTVLSISDRLNAIFEYYGASCGKLEIKKINKMVAAGVSSYDRSWTWRYMVSIKNGTMKPSRVVANAIDRHYREITRKPKKKKPRPDNRLRPMQIKCTREQYDQILELNTVERAKILMKDKE